MDSIRKPLALIIIVFVGLPALFHVIWIVGLTRAVSQPDFIPQLPSRLGEQLPQVAEAVFDAAQHPEAFDCEEDRAWVLAASQANTSPEQLLYEIGFQDWLDKDLSHSLKKIYKILAGESRPRDIHLDFRPLKQAFHHEAIDRYFLEILDNLPPCNAHQQAQWESFLKKRYYRHSRYEGGPPPAKPSQDIILLALSRLQDREIDLPDHEIMFNASEFQNRGINLFTIALVLSLLLFIAPGLILLVGANVAETMNFLTFRWFGIPLIVGGAITFISAFLPKLLMKLVSKIIIWSDHFQENPVYWSDDLVNAFTSKVMSLPMTVLDPLLSPVMSTSIFTLIIGLGFLSVSFIADKSLKPVINRPPPVPRS